MSKLPLSRRKAGEEARGKDKVGECPKKYGAQRKVEVDKVGLLLTVSVLREPPAGGVLARELHEPLRAVFWLWSFSVFQNPCGMRLAREFLEPLRAAFWLWFRVPRTPFGAAFWHVSFTNPPPRAAFWLWFRVS